MRAVDLFCLLLVSVAAIVAMSGGFRVRLGDWRIALTSPYRLLIWAVILAAIRHVAVPGAPIYRDLPRRLAGWWRAPGVASAAWVVAGTRPAILFVGYLAVATFGYVGGHAPLRSSDNEVVNLPQRWDAGWYLQIVTDGYSYVPDQPDVQQNVVFFPAYPMLMRGVGRLLGGVFPGSYLLAGTLVSFAALFFALAYLYALARDYLDDDQAASAQWLLAAYPFALFYGAIYVESLFLLGIVGCFYHFTRRQYWAAAAWGLVVGLTKANGFELSLPLGILAVSAWLPRWMAGRLPPARHQLSRAAIAVAAPCIGTGIFSAFIWQLTGHPLAWLEGHAAWGRTYQGFSMLVTNRVNVIEHAGLAGYASLLPYDLLNGLGVLFVLAAAWPVGRRLGVAYAVFILAMMLPPLSSGGLLSAGRFSSVLFPVFIWLAGAVGRPQRAGWFVTFAAIQGLNAALFYTWRPLY